MNDAPVARVVFDCMIFLQGAARATSPAKACLKLAADGLIELCLSAAIRAEVADVLSRALKHSDAFLRWRRRT